MKTTFQSLWSRRCVRVSVWTLITLATFAVLLAKFHERYAEKQWRAVHAEVEAAGETFDFRAILPEPVADPANFCATPALLGLATEKSGKATRQSLAVFELKAREGSALPPADQPALTGIRPYLTPWVQALVPAPDAGPADLLASLSPQDSIAAELHAALRRPSAQWTPLWRDRLLPDHLFTLPLPHYATSNHLARSLALRAQTRTTLAKGQAIPREGQATLAHLDLRVILRLAEANFTDPLLIGLLVGTSHTSLAANGAWSLCEARSGSAEEFEQLSRAFAELDLEEAALNAWRGELAAGVSSLNALTGSSRWSAAEREAIFGDSGLPLIGIPRSILRENIANLAAWEWKYCLEPLRQGGLRALHAQSANLAEHVAKLRVSPHRRPGTFIAATALPASGSVASTLMLAESLRTQATIACALERHFLSQGSYPESLDVLGTLALTDPWSGEAMRYERTTAGRYRLWSLGPDRVDDGGKRQLDPAVPAKTKFRHDSYRGDWVWDYPEG